MKISAGQSEGSHNIAKAATNSHQLGQKSVNSEKILGQGKPALELKEVGRDSKASQVKFDQAKDELSRQDLDEAVNVTNEVMTAMDRGLQFSIHEGTNRTMVKVVDKVTNEVVREIPPEKLLDMVAKMWEVVGLFVDEKI